MLTQIGMPFLRWLDEEVLPEAAEMVANLQAYVGSWRNLLEDREQCIFDIAS
jgi:hypothetical protein